MNILKETAIALIYVQSIIASSIGVVWLADKAFDAILNSFKIKAIFREYLIDRVFTHGAHIRRRMRPNPPSDSLS